MKNTAQQHILTYYTTNRCSAEDTQDLYLGFEELKPVISLINQIQIKQKEIAIGGKGFQHHCKLHLEIDHLFSDMEDLLDNEVRELLKKEKK